LRLTVPQVSSFRGSLCFFDYDSLALFAKVHLCLRVIHCGLLLIERVRVPLGGAGVSIGRTFKIAFSLAILSQL
jgi:hypothetical protein